MEVYRKSPVTITLVLLNMGMFLFTDLLRWGNGALQDACVLYLPALLEKGEYYRLLTSIFVHFGMSHLGNNMLLLFVLGEYLEKALGKWRFLLLYFVGGVGGNLVSCWWELQTGDFYYSAGASGAIFAVMGGLLYAVMVSRGQLYGFTVRQMLLMAALSLYFGFTSTGVNQAAHLGGILLGFLTAGLVYRRKRPGTEAEG